MAALVLYLQIHIVKRQDMYSIGHTNMSIYALHAASHMDLHKDKSASAPPTYMQVAHANIPYIDGVA